MKQLWKKIDAGFWDRLRGSKVEWDESEEPYKQALRQARAAGISVVLLLIGAIGVLLLFVIETRIEIYRDIFALTTSLFLVGMIAYLIVGTGFAMAENNGGRWAKAKRLIDSR